MIREALKGCFLPTKYFVWYFFSILSPSCDYIGGEKKIKPLKYGSKSTFLWSIKWCKKGR